MILWTTGALAGVMINEFLPNPDGADGGYEWVELYNDGPPVELAGWSIERATSSFAPVYVFEEGNLGSGEYWVLGGDQVEIASVWTGSLGLGNAGSSADGVRLVDPQGRVVDTVIYGAVNSDGFVMDGPGLAPVPVSGASLARSPSGVDTNQGADFVVALSPTPLAENGSVACGEFGQVVINELLPDPAGADAGNEWVELYNASDQPVDLSGWVIAAGTSVYSSLGQLPEGMAIAPGGFVVVRDIGFVLGNAANADAVQLRACDGTVVDTVVYGTENTDGWLNDLGEVATLAPFGPSGQSVARAVDGVDTDAGTDFVVQRPTPGESNIAAPCGGEVVINELLINPTGGDAGREWVELYNAGEGPVDLHDWTLQSTGASTWSVRAVLGSELAPHGFLLIAGEEIADADALLTGTLGNGAGGDGLRLVDCTDRVVDSVVYGLTNDDQVLDPSGEVAEDLAPLPPEDGALQRRNDGLDTNSGSDFVVAARATPGEPNIPVEERVCEPITGEVRINELLVDPSGQDAEREWFELYNPGPERQDLAGWSFVAATKRYDIHVPIAGSLGVGEFLVIGGSQVPEVDLVVPLQLGNGTHSRDALRLYDCEGEPVDTVIYGTANLEDPDLELLDDRGVFVEPYGAPGKDQTLARALDGVDQNVGDDWRISRPTPGITNELDPPAVHESPSVGCLSSQSPPSEPPRAMGCSSAPLRIQPLLWLCVLVVRRRKQLD